MTYDQDPNLRRRQMAGDDTSYTGWIVGALAAVALIAGGFWMFNRDDGATSTASNANRPAATAPATTTGSGTTSPAPANR